MDRFIQTFFLIFLPFYPLWGWFFYSSTKKPASMFMVLMLIPLAVYLLITQRIKIPKYLIFLILFTIYHLASTLMNHLIPAGTNKIFFLLADFNVFACLALIVIESTSFDEIFINKMTRLIFVSVIITCIVSIIQIKDTTFFISPELTNSLEGLAFLMGNRNFSIFSWVNLNSLGVSFPILIAILLSLSHSKKRVVPITIVSGILVSFLTRSRYVMISTVIAISQLFFNAKIELRKKVYMFLLLSTIVLMLVGIASISGFSIKEVIDSRILEKESGMESAKARITSYEVFMIKFPEYPWFGVGPSTRDDVLRMLDGVPIIHVGYLSYLYFYGIVGCFLLFVSFFYLLRYAWIIGKKHAFWGSFYGLFSFCIANITFVYFNLSEMGILLAVIYLKYFSDKSTESFQNEIA
jgi:hypothetical protein